jgi:hypothetical protein
MRNNASESLVKWTTDFVWRLLVKIIMSHLVSLTKMNHSNTGISTKMAPSKTKKQDVILHIVTSRMLSMNGVVVLFQDVTRNINLPMYHIWIKIYLELITNCGFMIKQIKS